LLKQLSQVEFCSMNDRYSQVLPPLAIMAGCLFAGYVAVFHTGYLSNAYYLGALIVFQIVIAALCNYRQRFFPLLIVVFFLASTDLPSSGAWTSGRWFVLAVGALVGFVIYMKDRQHHFGAFHLVALFCALAALISAEVSSYPTLAYLKAISLFLLFLYGASGARLAIMGREAKFFSGLLLGCEILVYYSVIARYILRIDDNPNTVGALMGVVAMPIMLWGILVSETNVRRRRTFAFILSLVLLLGTYSRAGIVAGVASCFLLCIALRQYRLLIKGVALGLMAAALVASLVSLRLDSTPTEEEAGFASGFLYKGHRDVGVLGSRKPIWDQTVASIQKNPWFGTGFGTATASEGSNEQYGMFATTSRVTKEHGNSYLAIAEWVGLLGVVPFFTLVFLIALNVVRVTKWMRHTSSPLSAAVPIAAVLAAGLVHAAFEDWLFAVGYHLCVFFWALAFVLVDVLPAPLSEAAQSGTMPRTNPWAGGLSVVTPSR
jgi:O-antigen ligase